MTAKYFEDTDTLYLVFRDSEVVETRDLDDETLVDYDADGRLVAMTLEHARNRVDGPEISLETIAS